MIEGQTGDDRISGLDGVDLICGGGGDDVILGGNEGDAAEGGGGDDVIREGGGGGNTLDAAAIAPGVSFYVIVYGGPGEDRLFGGGGNDALYGDAGDDELRGNAGHEQSSAGLSGGGAMTTSTAARAGTSRRGPRGETFCASAPDATGARRGSMRG